MSTFPFKHILSILNDYDVFLFDVWGVINEEDCLYTGVIDDINHIIRHKKVFFITNAPKCVVFMTRYIKALGIDVKEEMVISSGMIAIQMLRYGGYGLDIKDPFIYHFGRSTNNLLDSYALAVTTDIHQANVVLLTLCCDEREREIVEAAEYTLQIISKKNILTLCADPDLGFIEQGTYRYSAGYFAEKIKKLGGKVVYAGKPYPEIYHEAVARLTDDIPKQRMLMVGDTLHTDILGANQIGIHSALVLTGNAAPFHNAYDTLEEKLLQLTIAFQQHNVMPNFIVQIGKNQT